MEFNRFIRIFLVCLFVIFPAIFIFSDPGLSRPKFYLATDKSFGMDETPYINVEGPGNNSYEFRVYNIEDPVSFIKKSVKERLVTESNNFSYGDAVAIFRQSLQHFKNDFRKVARKEFNFQTRSYLKQSAGVNYDKPSEQIDAARIGLLKGYKLLFSFSVPEGKNSWSYRRISVPVSENGIFLVEGVSGSDIGYTLLVKSGMNFVTKQSDNQTLIYAASRVDGSPVPKTNVIVLNGNSGNTVFTGSTTEKGILELNRKSPEKSLIILKKDKEYAISDPNFYARSFYGAGGYRVFLYTDRPIYKPGDEVSFKGIVRRFENDSYRLASGSGTASIVDVQGKVIIDNIPVTVSGAASSFSGSFELPEEYNISLGIYNLVVNYNNENFSTEFSVEAYKKPEFLVKVSTPKKIYIGSEKVPVTVNARYYYGEPVKEGTINYKVFRTKKFDYSPVGQLPFFIIDPEYLGIDSSNRKRDLIVEKKAELDVNGIFSFEIEPGEIDDDYTYSIIASVNANNSTISGAASFSVNRSEFFIRITKESSVYSPGDSVKFKTEFRVFDTTLDAEQAEKLISNRTVKAILYTRSFRNISGEAERREVASETRNSDKTGITDFSFEIPSGGHYILVCSASDSNGEETIAQSAIWASGKSDSIQVPFKNISLLSKKDIYSKGDKAEVLIMTPAADGTLFVTLEANRILRHDIVKLKGNSYKYSFNVSENISPNCTLSVLQFSGNEIYRNQIKIVAPPVHRFINLSVKPQKKTYRPGEKATVIINATDYKKKGVKAEVSVAVVDEAVFQLQEDKNPPIATYFYHPRRNNVNTTLSSAYRFFGYSEAKRLQLALAGKTDTLLAAIKDEEKSRENYRDTCYWTAKVMTDSSGKAVVSFPLADNITTWRVTAIAVSSDTKVGQGKTKFISRKNLMMKTALPSYILKGEKHTVAAHVSNLTKENIDAVVSLKSENISVDGEDRRKVKVGPGEVKPVYFTVIAPEDSEEKECIIDLQVKGGGHSDGVRKPLQMKHFGLERTISQSVKIGKNGSGEISLDLPADSLNRKIEIQISPGYGEALRQSLSYLVDYPYGCIEQTMSRFMPVLAAKNTGYIDPQVSRDLSRMVSRGLSLLMGHQKDNGGFSWFGEQDDDALMSAYIYRGLVLCKKYYGQSDDKMMARTRRYLYNYMNKKDPDEFSRAYILAALSEGGSVERSMAERLAGITDKQTAYGKALTSLVLMNSKMQDEAEDIFEEALKQSGFKGKDDYIFPTNITEWSMDPVETAAALLTAAVRLKEDEETISWLASLLLINRNNVAWKNSRDTAMAVLALSEQLENFRDSGNAEIRLSFNGIEQRKFNASPDAVEKADSLIIFSGETITAKNVIEVDKSGGVPLYVNAVAYFTDRSSSFAKENNGFEVERTYYLMEGERDSSGKYSFSSSERTEFNQGDLVMVELSVKMNGNNNNYIMIKDPLIPGFSVVRKDSEYFSSEYKKEYSSIQFFSDYAALFIPNRIGANSYMLRYFMHADLPGKYKVMPAKAGLMYYPQVNGNSTDSTVSIK